MWRPPPRLDIRTQLAWLVPAGFLITTPWERLQELPRFLQALEHRLEKALRDPRRDAVLMTEAASIETRYRDRVKDRAGTAAPGRRPVPLAA